MKSKKSQGLSINIIIIAAIALVALVIIIAIFTNFFGETSRNIGSCKAKGGECADENGQCPEGYPIKMFVSGDCQDAEPKNLCCLKTSNE